MKNILEDVLVGLLMRGSDRGALVRDDGPELGVCVLVLSVAAAHRLGAALTPLVIEMDNPVREPSPVTAQTPLKDLFADATPDRWSWFEFRFGTTLVNGSVFVGPICERVAAACTAAGAPCSLNPDQPAPGYQLEETEAKE